MTWIAASSEESGEQRASPGKVVSHQQKTTQASDLVCQILIDTKSNSRTFMLTECQEKEYVTYVALESRLHYSIHEAGRPRMRTKQT